MAEKDYYKTLGVNSDATAAEIRKAYRKLAKKYHPDRHGGSKAAEEKFKAIGDAYSVLSDPDKRKQYDRLRRAGMRGGPQMGPGGFEEIFQQFGGAGTGGRAQGFSDLFSRIFGGSSSRAQRAPRRRGSDLVSSITVPFETAARGGEIEVTVQREKPCPNCDGTGADPGSTVETCPHCQGSGQVLAGQGGFSVSRPCPACFGRGKIIQTPCGRCRGSGGVEEPARVKVTIPKGINDGQRMRLAGMGQPGAGDAPAGDLMLEVHIAPHSVYTRKGRDIHSKVRVDMVDAALGKEVDVQTLQGPITVKIPPGTQPGRKLRVPGYGLETSDGRRGDHYVEVQVSVPRDLTPEQKRLLERLRRTPAAARK